MSILDLRSIKTKGSVSWACVAHLSFCLLLNTEPPIGASHQVLVIWLNSYVEIDQSETRMACGGLVYWRTGTKWAVFIDDLPRMLPTKIRFIWQSGFREEDFFRNRPSRKKNYLWGPCLLTNRAKMNNLYRGPSTDVSYQASVHLAKRFQRRILKISQSETKIACGGHIC